MMPWERRVLPDPVIPAQAGPRCPGSADVPARIGLLQPCSPFAGETPALSGSCMTPNPLNVH